MEHKNKLNGDYKSKLKNLEELETPDVWVGISSGVKKKMFYRFSWQYFNIYYLVAIVSMVVIIVGILVYNKNTSVKKDIFPPSIKTDLIKTEIVKDSIIVPNNINKKSLIKKTATVTIQNSTKDSSKRNNEIIHIKPEGPSIVISKKDSIQSIPKKEPVTTKVEVKNPVVVIRKRDTIIDVDTIHTYKKRKRR